MPWTIQTSAILNHAEIQNLYEGHKGNGVLSGGVLTGTGTDRIVSFTAFTAIVNGTSISVGASTVTHGAGDASLPRMDLIECNSSGTVAIVAGTPTAESASQTRPPLPALTANSIVLGVVYVPIAATVILDANVFDRRVILGSPNPFDGVRAQFRANRRMTAEYSAQPNTAAGTGSAVGIGLYQKPSGSSDVPTLLSGETYMLFGSAASGTDIGVFPGSNFDSITPNRSPRFLMRVLLPAASANVSYWTAGLGGSGATMDQAGLRIVTTGNTFFVTRQTAAETVTDLGALSRTVILGFEIETTDAGVTWVCRNQAGTQLASHTENVPTATAAEESGIYYTYVTSTIPMGIAYWRAEATYP